MHHQELVKLAHLEVLGPPAHTGETDEEEEERQEERRRNHHHQPHLRHRELVQLAHLEVWDHLLTQVRLTRRRRRSDRRREGEGTTITRLTCVTRYSCNLPTWRSQVRLTRRRRGRKGGGKRRGSRVI